MERNGKIYTVVGVRKIIVEGCFSPANKVRQVRGAVFCCEVFRSRPGLYSHRMPTQTLPRF